MDSQDLRKILKTLFHSYSPRNETLAVNEATDQIMELIAAHTQRARISENERYVDMLETGKWRSFATEVNERLTELKATHPDKGGSGSE